MPTPGRRENSREPKAAQVLEIAGRDPFFSAEFFLQIVGYIFIYHCIDVADATESLFQDGHIDIEIIHQEMTGNRLVVGFLTA